MTISWWGFNGGKICAEGQRAPRLMGLAAWASRAFADYFSAG
jgi:hypothetical protein